MDQPVEFSEAAAEHALSPEPVQTRPNPFDDCAQSSRKRRRTSPRGSRSLSADTVTSDQQVSSRLETDQGDHQEFTNDIEMTIVSRSPTHMSERSSTGAQGSDPPSDRLTTINLRQRELSDILTSPNKHTSQDTASNIGVPGDTNKGDGDRDMHEVQHTEDRTSIDSEGKATPLSTTISTASPEVEIVAISQDGDDPVVSVEEDSGACALKEVVAPVDPTTNFPFHDQPEPIHAAVGRLAQYFQGSNAEDESALTSLLSWSENCLEYMQHNIDLAVDHIRLHRSFWQALPDLMYYLAIKRCQYSRVSHLREIANRILHAYSAMIPCHVEHDMRVLDACRTQQCSDETQHPNFTSGPHAQCLSFIGRWDLMRSFNKSERGSFASPQETYALIKAFQDAPGGGLSSLLKLVQSQISLMSHRLSIMVEVSLPSCRLVSTILAETVYAIHNQNRCGTVEARVRLSMGFQFFEVIAEAFKTIIKKHVTHISSDQAQSYIATLVEILSASLKGEHSRAIERLDNHRTTYPQLAGRITLEAIVWEWRLKTLATLVMSSQMQLRVMAIGQMSNELVGLWKRCSESAEGSLLLKHLADYLHRIGIVEYILGPTCHPEITGESGNILGFLVVNDCYRQEQTDLLWHTISTAQDPRVCEGLLRMIHAVINLFGHPELQGFYEKFQDLSVEKFTPTFRQLCDYIFKQSFSKHQPDEELSGSLPFQLCIRLLREASILSPENENQIRHPELQAMAMARFKDLLNLGLDGDARKDLYTTCIRDISVKSPTVLGSMWCLAAVLRPSMAVELRMLATDYDLTRVMVEEIEHAAHKSQTTRLTSVLNGPGNSPRRSLLSSIMIEAPKSITTDLGMRLSEVFFGHKAVSQEDRNAGWQILNSVGNKTEWENFFISTCFSDYLPRVPTKFLQAGTFQFVKAILLRHVQSTENVFDDPDGPVRQGIEQLWRMILLSEDQHLAASMIHTLVQEVYVDSTSILAYSSSRAQGIHLDLINRCLHQLRSTAEQLRSERTEHRDQMEQHDSIVDDDAQGAAEAPELLFARSLAVLREFQKAHQSKAQFSVPDLRSLTLPSPAALKVRGQSAELKYQSFNGPALTGILPLDIGCQNTAASLLATLKEATGFDNYRVYFKGFTFAPDDENISKSLEDLHIQSGLLLVKKEATDATLVTKITKQGTSVLELEILSNFTDLWSYLGLQAELAADMYDFLIKLPANAQTLEAINQPEVCYDQIFPAGETYKCLYAAYALREFLASAQRRSSATQEDDDGVSTEHTAFATALYRARSLVVAALSDSELFDHERDAVLRSQLYAALVSLYLRTLNDEITNGLLGEGELSTPTVERMVDILSVNANLPRNNTTVCLLQEGVAATLLSAAMSLRFWTEFQTYRKAELLIRDLLLKESVPIVRAKIAAVINTTLAGSRMLVVSSESLREYFWRILSIAIPETIAYPNQCREFFGVTIGIVNDLIKSSSEILDARSLVFDCFLLLQEHESLEQLGCNFAEDFVIEGLAKLIWLNLTANKEALKEIEFPSRIASKLFWQHLFPKERRLKTDRVPKVALSHNARYLVYEILLNLAQTQVSFAEELLSCLQAAVPFDCNDQEDQYSYELLQGFDPSQAVRASCGYTGLRNLSNTCYLNSLITQLFMNTSFRQFMIAAPIQDEASQELLLETQKVFAFMQESCRRCVDPYAMVASIRTYDDTMIDINQQMDVDEFYNLLFDRWEAQFPSTEQRKTFRSYYGGQLVQQVKSKECEHVSERLEPFSAIQCDIKGKRSLAESLQAYVDGEIMQGDNKYKCSTCDRHVDAVKRACLRDVPDNMIFHLKRFDFNLRTMMRSKINDYFSFPTQLDMRPYTIEHLAGESESMEPDLFELVGILVHAGTAESGHYYSYLRERPSTADRESWVEFNDDVVTPWDSARIEDATFGASELRTTFDNNGVPYERPNSAYMLFYQRASVLETERQALCASGGASPLKVEMPLDLFDTIMNDNIMVTRRHCLYDHHHMAFALRLSQYCTMPNGGPCSTEDHSLQDASITMLLGHFDQAVSRARDLSTFEHYCIALDRDIQSCHRCASAFFSYFRDRHEPFRQLIQRNSEPGVRARVGDLFINALRKIRACDPDIYGSSFLDPGDPSLEGTIVGDVTSLFRTLWNSFQVNTRTWTEVFGLVHKFAQLGTFETAALLNDDWLANLMLIIAADPNFPQLPQQYNKLLLSLARRGQSRPPAYSSVIDLILHLFKALVPRTDDFHIVCPDERLSFYMDDPEGLLPWCKSEVEILLEKDNMCGSLFIRKLLELEQNMHGTDAIIHFLSSADERLQLVILRVLDSAISGKEETYTLLPYLRATIHFLWGSKSQKHGSYLFRQAAEACGRPDVVDGRSFLEFFQAALDALSKLASSETPVVFFDALPIWAPNLLGYYDRNVALDTERYLLHELLPQYEVTGQEQLEAHEPVVRIARELAVRCLHFLRVHYVQAHRETTSSSIEPLRTTINYCEKFFMMDIEGGTSLQEFRVLRQETYESLQRWLVEELEDDGSDWGNSVSSSEHLENAADLSIHEILGVQDSGMSYAG